MPFKFSHKPPEARIWLATITLAPPVPRKVMVLVGLFSFTANVNIDYGCIFYNQIIRLFITLTPFIPLSLKGEGET